MRPTDLNLGELGEAEFGDRHARGLRQLERVKAGIGDERLAGLPAVACAAAERKVGLGLLFATVGLALVDIVCSLASIFGLIVRLDLLLVLLLVLLLFLVLLGLLFLCRTVLLPRALLRAVLLLSIFLNQMLLVHSDTVGALQRGAVALLLRERLLLHGQAVEPLHAPRRLPTGRLLTAPH